MGTTIDHASSSESNGWPMPDLTVDHEPRHETVLIKNEHRSDPES